MQKEKIEILKFLAKPKDYFAGIKLLEKYSKTSRGIIGTISRRKNPWNISKLKYLLIKHLNIPELTEANQISKSSELLNIIENRKIKISISESESNKKVAEILSESFDKSKEDIEYLKNSINILLPKKMSDKEYVKWFYKQPEKIQELLKEQSRLTRQRAKLHTDCRFLKGNSNDEIYERKLKLSEMDEITKKIKEIHLVIKIFKVKGKLIFPKKQKCSVKVYNLSETTILKRERELRNTKNALTRNRESYTRLKGKNLNNDKKREAEIAYKIKKIAILQDWYEENKHTL